MNVLFEKPGKLGPEHRGCVYVDTDEQKTYAVVESFHCAGGLDEHTYNCRLEHWTEYSFDLIDPKADPQFPSTGYMPPDWSAAQ